MSLILYFFSHFLATIIFQGAVAYSYFNTHFLQYTATWISLELGEHLISVGLVWANLGRWQFSLLGCELDSIPHPGGISPIYARLLFRCRSGRSYHAGGNGGYYWFGPQHLVET